jgi:hypothetical protein
MYVCLTVCPQETIREQLKKCFIKIYYSEGLLTFFDKFQFGTNRTKIMNALHEILREFLLVCYSVYKIEEKHILKKAVEKTKIHIYAQACFR